MKILRGVVGFYLCIAMQLASSETCEEVFSSTLASSGPTASITLNWGSSILNAPGGELTTLAANLTQNDPSPCGSSSCTASGSIGGQMESPSTFNGGSSIYVGYQNTYVMTPGHYNSFQAGTESIVYFSPGDYYIKKNFSLDYLASLRISSNGTVRIYVNGTIQLNSSSQANMVDNSNRYLFFFTNRTFAMQDSTVAKAVVYAKDDASMNSNSTLYGAISSEAEIAVQYNAVVDYSGAQITSMDFGESCGTDSVPSLASFDIDIGGGAGSTCSEFSVDITARDSSDATLSDYTGTIQLSTSNNNGDWSKTGTASDAAGTLTAGATDSGEASYEFNASDNGTITLYLSNSHAETITISVEDSSEGVTSTSSNITFSDNAFVINYDEDVIAGRDHALAVFMMRRSPAPASSDCAIATTYNVANVKIYLTRHADDPGGAAPYLLNQAGSSNEQFAESYGTASVFNANFSGGVANLDLISSDVGKYSVNFLDDSASFSDSVIAGGSSVLIARPFGFLISAAGNPAAADHNGAVFTQAGANFTTTVTAVGWQQADDVNNDGIPDGHNDTNSTNNADLSNNSALISFGQENSPESISVASNLILPNSGVDPGLSGSATMNGASNGSVSGVLSFSEVGIIEILANVSSGDYLGMGSLRTGYMASASGNVGRFIPSYFGVSDTDIVEACTSGLDYSYMDENFALEFTLSAMNSAGVVTQNYTGDFSKLSAINLLDDFVAADSLVPTELSDRLVPQGGFFAWTAGELNAQADFALNRSSGLDGPYESVSIGVNPIDSDGVSLLPAALDMDSNNDAVNDAAALGITEFRFGRLVQEQAFGPETADLPVNLRTEYWNGSVWRTNTDDSCTELLLSAISFPDGPADMPSNRTVSIGSGSTTGQYADSDAISVGFNNGDAGHYFSAPGSGNTGSFSIDIDLSGYPWLQFDWNGDGNFSEDNLPTTNITFGTYRGHDRILYWQEVLQ